MAAAATSGHAEFRDRNPHPAQQIRNMRRLALPVLPEDIFMRPLLLLFVFASAAVRAADNRCPLGASADPAPDDEDCSVIRIAIAPGRPEALEPVYLRLHGVDPDHTAIDTASVRHAGATESGAVKIFVRPEISESAIRCRGSGRSVRILHRQPSARNVSDSRIDIVRL